MHRPAITTALGLLLGLGAGCSAAAGGGFSFAGAMTMTLVQRDGGWRILGAHASSAESRGR